MKTLQDIKNAGTRLMGGGFMDEGILLEKIYDDLVKLQDMVKSHSMICPYCLSPLVAYRFKGYYDSFDHWGCKCDKLPVDKENICSGEYA
jgi:hypothetical protein